MEILSGQSDRLVYGEMSQAVMCYIEFSTNYKGLLELELLYFNLVLIFHQYCTDVQELHYTLVSIPTVLFLKS